MLIRIEHARLIFYEEEDKEEGFEKEKEDK